MIKPPKELKRQVPLSEYVIRLAEEANNDPKYTPLEAISSYWKVVDYTRFIKHEITLGMFVPVDEDGNILQDPNKPRPICRDCADGHGTCDIDGLNCDPDKRKEQYQQALNNVIFEGFEASDNGEHILLTTQDGTELTYSKIDGLHSYDRTFTIIEDLQSLKLKFKHHD